MSRIHILLLVLVAFVSWAVVNSASAYFGGREYTFNGIAYKSGPCKNVSGLLECPLGYTPCIDGYCYYVAKEIPVAQVKN
ncbi:hypothetical protein FO519_003864 [Halicephalobus sp. NKZ332]|nr:hypothetical protein FO519_003864 [Halicephalobus sp. NKZ332]